jgi:hypothetical protein
VPRGEAAVTDITPKADEPKQKYIDSEGLAHEFLTIPGRGTYEFRELTVEETDGFREASMEKDRFNGRTMMRLMVVGSAVEPKIALKELTKLPQRVYAAIIDFVNDMNDAASLVEETEDAGNS